MAYNENTGSLLIVSGAVSDLFTLLEAAHTYTYILVSKHNTILTIAIVLLAIVRLGSALSE